MTMLPRICKFRPWALDILKQRKGETEDVFVARASAALKTRITVKRLRNLLILFKFNQPHIFMAKLKAITLSWFLAFGPQLVTVLEEKVAPPEVLLWALLCKWKADPQLVSMMWNGKKKLKENPYHSMLCREIDPLA